MEPTGTLSKYYHDLKQELNSNSPAQVSRALQVSPKDPQWRAQASQEADKLVDGSAKRIILDIYTRILPLDPEFIAGNQAMMKGDVDNFLANKNMTATQYLTSCKESTNAPLVDFIIRSCKAIGQDFREKANETLKDAKENNLDVPPPKADENSEEVESQILDVTDKDQEYDEYIRKMRDITMDKIINQVTEIIEKEKKNNDLKFDPNPEVKNESTLITVVEHAIHQFMKAKVSPDSTQMTEIIGAGIRECTLNEIDRSFRQPGSTPREFVSKIRFNKGNVMNESTIRYIIESGTRSEPMMQEVDGVKYDVANFEKIDKDGQVSTMDDREARRILSPESYKKFKGEK